MFSKILHHAAKQFGWMIVCLTLLAATAHAQSTDLTGVIDIHAHAGPDIEPRSIDAIDLAKLAKARGMRGFVLKNHYEPTAAQAYLVRKVVPGIEVFGGISLDFPVGGVNPSAVEHMAHMEGGLGKVVWMPTFDGESDVKFYHQNRPYISVSKDGHLLPEVIQVIDIVAKYNLTLETGHSSATDGLMIVHEAHERGVQHIVVTHAMPGSIRMTIPQMQQAARDGAFLEFVFNSTFGPTPMVPIAKYAEGIRAVGPEHCILASDLGNAARPVHPDGLVLFFQNLRKEGISQADIDLMSKTNPAKALGLQ